MRLVRPENWRPEGIEDLEPHAWDALRLVGSACVIAGPGAGKTEFLAQKATYLLQTGVCPYPRQILAISFKKDAAENLKKRVEKRCPENQLRRFHSLTFDAFSKGIVDRFRLAIPSFWRPSENPEIIFPDRARIQSVLNGIDRSNALRPAALQVNTGTFERDIVSRTPLSIRSTGDEPTVDTGVKLALLEWWKTNLYGSTRSKLSFSMINRLAELIIRANPYIRDALRETYKFVFLDEYQDATNAQYQLIKTAFHDCTTVLTAVGDDKQRIMGWAGARNNIFSDFCEDYQAQQIELLFNHRSTAELVAIQYALARKINPQSGSPVARATRNIQGNAAAIWEFATRQDETLQIANWLNNELQNNALTPRDFAILVRNRPDDFVPELSSALSQHGIRLRNEARDLGRILIQDLLTEELTKIFIPLFKLGANIRDPQSWEATVDVLVSLEGLSQDDETGHEEVNRRLTEFVQSMRLLMLSSPTVEVARQIYDQCLAFIGRDLIQQSYLHYRQNEQFDRVAEGFNILIAEYITGSSSWNEVIDKFLGVGQIPVMTVHKSKGLEFHTMIFVGLDNSSWWSFNDNNTEEWSAFFVAFSRAKQRAFFSYCAERGSNTNFRTLYDLLRNAGVPISTSGIPPLVITASN